LIDWPDPVNGAEADDFTTVSAGAGATVTVALEDSDTTGAPRVVWPAAVAVFVTDPASTSAWVTVYGAVQVTFAPGASTVVEHVIVSAGDPEKADSVTAIFDTVTFPVFFTRNEYATASPALFTEIGDTDFTSVSAGAGSMVRIAVAGSDTATALVGDVPDAVALLVTVPASTSACATAYGAVQVTLIPGAREAAAAGHEIDEAEIGVPAPEKEVSVGNTFVRVTLPVLVMTNE
jgi:hypothetical protein